MTTRSNRAFEDVTPSPFCSEEFLGAAWRHAALAEARRSLLRYLPGPIEDDPERPHILCETAPFDSRFVPDAVVEEVIEVLRALEREAERELRCFKMFRVGERRETDPAPDAPRALKRRTAKARRRGRANTPASGAPAGTIAARSTRSKKAVAGGVPPAPRLAPVTR